MITKHSKKALIIVALSLLSGCVTMPTGPSVLVLPAPGKPIEEFQIDDMACRQWAGQQVGISAQDTANKNTISGSAIGTALGAGAGALLGAATGNVGKGAAIGAGAGLLFGTASGANAGQEYGWEAQKRYDYAYVQCMYTKGNQIPDQVHRYRLKRGNNPPSGNYPAPPDYPGSR